MVSSRSARSTPSATVEGSGPPSSQAGTSRMSLAKRLSTAEPYSSPKTPHQYQRAIFVVVGGVLGLVTDFGENGSERNELGLVGQIDHPVNLLLAQELGGALEAEPDRVAMLLVGGQRQIEQRLTGGADGGPVGFLLRWVSYRGEAQFLGVQQGNGLQKVGRGHVGEHALRLPGGAAEVRRGVSGGRALVGVVGLLVAEPVVAQLVTLGGIHGGEQLEGIERLATGVDLLEDEADGFVGRIGTERDDGNLVLGEVLEHFVLEAA